MSSVHMALPRYSTDRDEQSAATVDLPPQDQSWWRLTHALSFTVGGILFLVGTVLYDGIYPSTFANGMKWNETNISQWNVCLAAFHLCFGES